MNSTRYNQIIDEAWSNYRTAFVEGHVHQELDKCLPIEEFIEEIKSDNEFSEKCGLKIEERELSSEERKTLYHEHCMKNFWALKLHGTTLHYEHCMKDFWDLKITEMNEVDYEKANIPTKVITLTLNNEKIESYE